MIEENIFYKEQYAQLNVDQKSYFDTITTAIMTDLQIAYFFLQGSVGTEKTFLYTYLYNYYCAQDKIIICIALSSITALLLPGRQTSHFHFRILLELHEFSIYSITKNSSLVVFLQQAALIIWDKVLMQHKYYFKAIYYSLENIYSMKGQLFGGIPTVLGGNFAQILPVVYKGNQGAIINACI